MTGFAVTVPYGGELSVFDPVRTQERLAQFDGDIVRWRALKDWPMLEQAVDGKIAEQTAFVANWDVTVRPAGHQPNNAPGGYLAARDAVDRWGISQQTVSRWRTSLTDIPTYRFKIMLGARRPAGLDPEANHRAEGTGEFEWYTPPRFIAAARAVMGTIDLDPASHEIAQRVVQATRHFTIEDDGLSQEWHGKVWLNPPYSQPAIEHFAKKMVEEVGAGHTTEAVMLTHNYTDTAWFHIAASACAMICFTRGRIRFINQRGEEADSPTQGQAFFYYGTNCARFADVFGPIGLLVSRYAV